MSQSQPIVFYDITMFPRFKTMGVNPSKTRYALNFKGVNYKTEWVEFPDVTETRKSLDAAPVRKHPDGSDFYTLPVIKDLGNNGAVVGDSFDIAVYLDKQYPSGPQLFPTGASIGQAAVLNLYVDNMSNESAVIFGAGMKFNPEVEERSKQEFERRMGGVKWGEFFLSEEQTEEVWKKLESRLSDLSRAWTYGDGKGPFIDGERVTYGDMIVGGWLNFVKYCCSEKDWKRICGWHDGMWGKLHEALEKYAELK